MRIRKVKFWLWIGSGAMLVCAAGVVGMASGLPYPQSQPLAAAPPVNPTAENQAASPQEPALPPASHPVWRTALRKPLKDPPPKPPTTPVVQRVPPLRVQLLGTVIEPGWPLALVVADNKMQWVGVGDTVDHAEILAITPDRMTVRHHGREVQIAMPRKKETP